MGGVVIAIDPGEDTGWSKWIDGALVRCGLSHPKEYAELPFLMGLSAEVPTLVIELPQDYTSNRATDPNNLISLGYKVGLIAGIFGAYYHLQGGKLNPRLVWPAEWKGQVPKAIHHDRNLPKLRPAEKTVLLAALDNVPKSKRHDVKDAVCLGLWSLKR